MRASNTLRRFARDLRADSTDAERRLWYHLRSRRTIGAKFRRQQPIGFYIVDFACLELRLIIELDGGHHQGQVKADRRRDDFLCARGFEVLRFRNSEVLQHTQAVLEEIRAATERRRSSPPAPLAHPSS